MFFLYREIAEKKKRGEPVLASRANLNTAYDDEERWTKDAKLFEAANTKTGKAFSAALK